MLSGFGCCLKFAKLGSVGDSKAVDENFCQLWLKGGGTYVSARGPESWTRGHSDMVVENGQKAGSWLKTCCWSYVGVVVRLGVLG